MRIGEPARALLIQRREKTGFFEAFSSVIAERVVDLLCMVALGLVGLFLLPEMAYPSWMVDSLKIVGLLTLAALLALVLAAKKERPLLSLLDQLFGKTPLRKWKASYRAWPSNSFEASRALAITREQYPR